MSISTITWMEMHVCVRCILMTNSISYQRRNRVAGCQKTKQRDILMAPWCSFVCFVCVRGRNSCLQGNQNPSLVLPWVICALLLVSYYGCRCRFDGDVLLAKVGEGSYPPFPPSKQRSQRADFLTTLFFTFLDREPRQKTL